MLINEYLSQWMTVSEDDNMLVWQFVTDSNCCGKFICRGMGSGLHMNMVIYKVYIWCELETGSCLDIGDNAVD